MKLKQKPEDFVVREVFKPELSGGKFSYYLLRKRLATTQQAVAFASHRFRISPKYINFAGTKDRDAVTEQYISISRGPAKSLSSGDGRIELTYLGQGRERINLGANEGNGFEVVARDITKKPRPVALFPNYFDEQRFGHEMNNLKAGRFILQGKLGEACSLLPETQQHLEIHPQDFAGALRSIPKPILRFYPHAVQSYIWNLTASAIISRHPHKNLDTPIGKLAFPTKAAAPDIQSLYLPIPGHSTESLPKEMQEVLSQEGLALDDFRQPKFPEFNTEGSVRSLFAQSQNLSIGPLEKDELNPKKKKCLVKFFLPKGSYATMLLKAMAI